MRSGDHRRRPILLACLLAVLVGASAGFAVSAKPAGRDSTRVLLATNRFERLVADLETGQLRYFATRDDGALTPWRAARADLPRQAALLQRLAAENSPEQGRRAREIVRAVTSYLHEHAEPLVRKARRDRASARSAAAETEGRRRVEVIRRQVDRFAELQHRLAVARERDAVPALRRAEAVTAGAAGSSLLVLLLVGYVRRSRAPATRSVRPDREDRRRLAACEGLRRLSALVAAGASPAEVFSRAAGELGRALGAEHALICRYEEDETVTVTGHWSDTRASATMPPAGGRWPVEDETVTDLVYRTGRTAHLRADLPAVGPIGGWIRANRIRRLTGCPIVAGDRLWGMAAVLSREPGPWPAEETRTAEEFAGLLGVAAASARRRAELAASRVRLVAACDAARHRIERHLHERTQQRLVTVGLALRAAEDTVPPELDRLRGQLAAAATGLAEVTTELQEVARRLHPTFLARAGLPRALRAVARRAGVPVEVEVRGEGRVSQLVAVTVYHVAAEALGNTARHARASAARVTLDLDDPVRLAVEDDGVGGARLRPGASLADLKDRVEALGGTFGLESPPGAGTAVRVTVPADVEPPSAQG